MSSETTTKKPKQKRKTAAKKKPRLSEIDALMKASSITEAAKLAGVSRATMHNRLNDDAFVAKLREASTLATSAMSARLAGLVSDAVQVYADAMSPLQDVEQARVNAVRLRAADSVLNRIESIRELSEFDDRITRIEVKYESDNSAAAE